MVRPSQGLDDALLRSGVALYPHWGCAGLSVRRVAEHAGVNPAMLHYHFGSKQAFLQRLLQGIYESLFERLSAGNAQDGLAVDRLRAVLLALGQFLRAHRILIARLALDALSGEAAVRDVLRTNAPRHLGLLMQLLAQAQQEGDVRELPTLQRFLFVMGSVAAPLLAASGAVSLKLAPAWLGSQVEEEVFSDAAILQRIDLALLALGVPAPATSSRRRKT